MHTFIQCVNVTVGMKNAEAAGGGEGARAAGWRDLLRRDMGPIELAAYVGMVCAAWLGIILIAQRVDASHYGGPLEATLELFGRGLILVGAIHLGLVARWWKGLKNDARIGRLERRCDEYDARIRMLEARVDVPELHGQTEWIEEATPGPRSSRAHAPASGMA